MATFAGAPLQPLATIATPALHWLPQEGPVHTVVQACVCEQTVPQFEPVQGMAVAQLTPGGQFTWFEVQPGMAEEEPGTPATDDP
jgi:hypothetical protein